MPFKYILLVYVFLMGIGIGFAQTSPVYDESEYDGEYDYNNDYYTNSTAIEDRERRNERYRKSYREEELYNGRYKKHQNDDSYSGGFSVTTYSMGGSSESGSSSTGSISQYNSKNNRKHDFRDVGNEQDGTKPNKNDGLFSADGTSNPGDDPDTGDGGGGGIEGTPPPPPDEPDVPVNTAIPGLALAGLLLVGFKLRFRIS